MANKFYKTKNSYQRTGGTTMDPVSQTLQGEVRPIKEIIARALRGEFPNRKNVTYIDAEDLEYINRYYAPHSLDLTDLEALGQHVQRLQDAVETAKTKKTTEDTPIEAEVVTQEE